MLRKLIREKTIRTLGVVAVTALLASACSGSAEPEADSTPTGQDETETGATAGDGSDSTEEATEVELQSVTIAHPNPSTAQMFLWVAHAAGLFEEEGLDVELTNLDSGSVTLTALLGGDVDVAAVATPSVYNAAAEGQAVRIFAGLMYGQCCELTLRTEVAESLDVTADDPLEDRIAALEGLNLGSSSPGGGSDTAIRYLLDQGGLDPEQDVTITYLGGGGEIMVGAMAADRVDATMNNQPGSALTVLGGHGIYWIDPTTDVPGLGDALSTALVATDEFLSERPEVAESLTRALWRAKALMEEDPEGAQRLVETRFEGLDPEVFQAMWEFTEPRWEKAPNVTSQSIQAGVDFARETQGEDAPDVTFDEVATSTYVDATEGAYTE